MAKKIVGSSIGQTLEDALAGIPSERGISSECPRVFDLTDGKTPDERMLIALCRDSLAAVGHATPPVCIDGTQKELITLQLLDVRNRLKKAAVTIPEGDRYVRVKEVILAAAELIRPWVPLARLECDNCQNDKCESRDPDIPAVKV